jgi:hypothetical protein
MFCPDIPCVSTLTNSNTSPIGFVLDQAEHHDHAQHLTFNFLEGAHNLLDALTDVSPAFTAFSICFSI